MTVVVGVILHSDGVGGMDVLFVWRGYPNRPAEVVVLIPHLVAVDIRGFGRLAELGVVFRSGVKAQGVVVNPCRIGVHLVVILVGERKTLPVDVFGLYRARKVAVSVVCEVEQCVVSGVVVEFQLPEFSSRIIGCCAFLSDVADVVLHLNLHWK